MSGGPDLGWGGIARLGLVQAALGGLVVMTTSTLNRVMVVELGLPAVLPGLLVALHYLVQIARPRMGHGSDQGGRRTPWILGGMLVLALGSLTAAAAVAWMDSARGPGLALAVLGFVLVGLGVSAGGTALLTLLAKRVAPARRAPAATVVWLMMIFGFALTAGLAGAWLDPYSPQRLLAVSFGVALLALLISVLALRGLEGPAAAPAPADPAGRPAAAPLRFRAALAAVWDEAAARRFTIFVFVSMLAFSTQDLILEPFAGLVFGYSAGQSTQLAGAQHGGVLVGMLLAATAGGRFGGRPVGTLRGWMVGGCLASALALAGLVMAGQQGPGWPLLANVVLLGVANGVFSIAAIGSMMQLAGQGGPGREGLRMGLWGGAQALAFGLGGLLGTVLSDLANLWIDAPGPAYALVFAGEALLFLVAAAVARGIQRAGPAAPRSPPEAGLRGPWLRPGPRP